MTGIIQIGSGKYIFRDDHAHEPSIWAWGVHSDYSRSKVHKWNKIPNNANVELFDIDNPPSTVSYQPLLD